VAYTRCGATNSSTVSIDDLTYLQLRAFGNPDAKQEQGDAVTTVVRVRQFCGDAMSVMASRPAYAGSCCRQPADSRRPNPRAPPMRAIPRTSVTHTNSPTARRVTMANAFTTNGQLPDGRVRRRNARHLQAQDNCHELEGVTPPPGSARPGQPMAPPAVRKRVLSNRCFTGGACAAVIHRPLFCSRPVCHDTVRAIRAPSVLRRPEAEWPAPLLRQRGAHSAISARWICQGGQPVRPPPIKCHSGRQFANVATAT
jgi:hypothetical protein